MPHNPQPPSPRWRAAVRGALACVPIVWAIGAGAQSTTDSFSITPVYQSNGDLESGGDAGYTGVFATLGRSWTLDTHSTLRLSLGFDTEDWDFNGLAAFGGMAPWGTLYRANLSLPYSYTTDGGWRLSFSPTLEYSGESGAGVSDALEYGALVSAARRLSPDLTLGLGVGAYERIEQTRVFPFLIVDWRIGERLRLTNPLPAGPAGPAGLELSYTLGSNWEIGIAGAFRSFRFRLDDDGPAPDGIGENSYLPVVARIGRRLSGGLSFNLYAGAALSGNLRVEDENGYRLYDEDRDPAMLLGVSLVGRF